MIEEIQRKLGMQMIIMAVKALHPHQKKDDVVPVIVCKQPVSNGK